MSLAVVCSARWAPGFRPDGGGGVARGLDRQHRCAVGRPRATATHVERSNLTMQMGMRRFTRLTNGFSRKVENHAYAVDIHLMVYNFARPHMTLTKVHPLHYPQTPAVAAGIAGHVWSVEEICGLLDPSRLIGAIH